MWEILALSLRFSHDVVETLDVVGIANQKRGVVSGLTCRLRVRCYFRLVMSFFFADEIPGLGFAIAG